MKALSGLTPAHDGALLVFAALVGLVEGPAQLACAGVLGLAVLTGRWTGFRPGLFSVGVAVWALAGYATLGPDFFERSSGETTRPLMALAAGVGARSLARSSPQTLGRVAWAFGIAITINAAYGLLQIGAGAFPWDHWSAGPGDATQGFIAVPAWPDRVASGLFYHRLRLGQVGIVGLALSFVVASSPSVERRTRWAAGGAIAVVLPALLGTYVRTPWVGLTGAVVMLLLLLARPWAALGTLASGGVAGAVLLATPQGARRFASWPEDWAIRKRMFSAALEVFSNHPWFGVGHGGYRKAVHGMPDLTGVQLTSPHNLGFQVLAETGLVGAVAFGVAFAVTLGRLGGRIWGHRREDSPEVRLERVAFLGLVALMATGFVHFTLHHAVVGLVFWTLAGVAQRR